MEPTSTTYSTELSLATNFEFVNIGCIYFTVISGSKTIRDVKIKEEFIMNNLKEMLVNEESGQGMVEYALIIAFIAVACLVGVKALGTNINNLFNGIKFSN